MGKKIDVKKQSNNDDKLVKIPTPIKKLVDFDPSVEVIYLDDKKMTSNGFGVPNSSLPSIWNDLIKEKPIDLYEYLNKIFKENRLQILSLQNQNSDIQKFLRKINYIKVIYCIQKFNESLGPITFGEICKFTNLPESTVSGILKELINHQIIKQPLDLDPYIMYRQDVLKYATHKSYSEFYKPNYDGWDILIPFERSFSDIDANITEYRTYWRKNKLEYDKHKETKDYKKSSQFEKFLAIFREHRGQRFTPKQLQDLLVYRYCVTSNQRWIGEMLRISEQSESPTKQTGWRDFFLKIKVLTEVDVDEITYVEVNDPDVLFSNNKILKEAEKEADELTKNENE